MFTKIINKENGSVVNVVRLFDSAYIPADESNTDYQEYLAWIAKGNEPEIVEID